MMLGAIQSQMLIGKRIKHWSPADLFANGEQGSFWGPLPYYSDAAGTVEAGWGDPVGNIPDASGNEQDWTQVTSTARPILGRVPVGGRRNQSIQTENFADGVWEKSGLSVSTDALSTPDGSLTAEKLVESATSETHKIRLPGSVTIGTQYTISCYAKAAERSRVAISRYSQNGFSETGTYYFDLSNGTVSNPPTADDYGIEDAGNGWYRCWITKTATTSAAFQGLGFFIVGSSGEFNYAGDGTSGIYIWGAQFETGSVATPYQRVGNEYDITEAGVKGIHYLRFDGTDDDLPNTLPAIQGTIVLAGVNGIWIDSLDFAGGAFSVGPDTYTGGPAGLMSILGDILERGCFVIDRELTPEEIAQVERYYKARGSAGLIELGPEEKQNYLFPGSPGMAEYISGGDYFRIERSGSSIGIVSYEIEPTPALYLAQYEWLSGSTVGVRDNASVMSGYGVSAVDPLRNIVLSVATGSLRFYHGSTEAESTFRVISLRRLIMPGEMP